MNADEHRSEFCVIRVYRCSSVANRFLVLRLARYPVHSVDGTVSFSGSSDCGGGAADAAVKGPAGARRCDAWIAGPAWGGACRVISARTADRSRLRARGVSADFRARGGALHLAAAGKRGAVQL